MQSKFDNKTINTMITCYLKPMELGFSDPPLLLENLICFLNPSTHCSTKLLYSFNVDSPKTFKFALIYWMMLQLFNPDVCSNAQTNFEKFKDKYPNCAPLLLSKAKKIQNSFESYFQRQSNDFKKTLIEEIKAMREKHDNRLIQLLLSYFYSLRPLEYRRADEAERFTTYELEDSNTEPLDVGPGKIYRYNKDGRSLVAYQDIFGQVKKDLIYQHGEAFDGIPNLSPDQKNQLLKLDDDSLKLEKQVEECRETINLARTASLCSTILLAPLGVYAIPLVLASEYYARRHSQQALLETNPIKKKLRDLNQQKAELAQGFLKQQYLETRLKDIDERLADISSNIDSPNYSELAMNLPLLHERCKEIKEDDCLDLQQKIESIQLKLKAKLEVTLPQYNHTSVLMGLYAKTIGSLLLAGGLAYGIVGVATSVGVLVEAKILLSVMMAIVLIYLMYCLYQQFRGLQFHHAVMAPEPNNDLALSMTP